MSSYIGKHAELYDLFYKEKDYQGESDFVHSLIQKYNLGKSQRLLEMACGTGNHAFCLEKNGYKVTATDYSPSMIKQAKVKAQEKQSSIDFEVRDMRDVKEIPEKYSTVICLFDSIGYLLTNENIKTSFSGVYEKLEEGGIFVLEFWHAAAMIKSYDSLRVKKWKLGESEILRISETEIDIPSQTCSVKYSIYETRVDGTYSYIEETQHNRFFLKQEMCELLRNSLFEVLESFAGYSNDKRIDENTWHIVTIARKANIKNTVY